MRRATDETGYFANNQEISIHALREEGDSYHMRGCAADIISIHALREEGD